MLTHSMNAKRIKYTVLKKFNLFSFIQFKIFLKV